MNRQEKVAKSICTQAAIAEVASVRVRDSGDYDTADTLMGISKALYKIIADLLAPHPSREREALETEVERYAHSMNAMQDDIAELLRALKISDHARPISPHELMQTIIIPHVRDIVGGGGYAPEPVVGWTREDGTFMIGDVPADTILSESEVGDE
jgi:hypothetical protein